MSVLLSVCSIWAEASTMAPPADLSCEDVSSASTKSCSPSGGYPELTLYVRVLLIFVLVYSDCELELITSVMVVSIPS